MTANCIQKTCASLRRVCAVALALCIALGALSLPVSARADAASFVQVSLAGANAYDSATTGLPSFSPSATMRRLKSRSCSSLSAMPSRSMKALLPIG